MDINLTSSKNSNEWGKIQKFTKFSNIYVRTISDEIISRSTSMTTTQEFQNDSKNFAISLTTKNFHKSFQASLITFFHSLRLNCEPQSIPSKNFKNFIDFWWLKHNKICILAILTEYFFPLFGVIFKDSTKF